MPLRSIQFIHKLSVVTLRLTRNANGLHFQIFRCSENLIYEALRQKKIRSIRIISRYLIPAAEIRRLLEATSEPEPDTDLNMNM